MPEDATDREQLQDANLVLIRHGQSLWNEENRFTGWRDVPLTDVGAEEAIAAGKQLKALGFEFDAAYTSVLKRAIHTLWLILMQMELDWLPVHRDWRLNERHYGALQGLNKADTAAQYGEAQVHTWRRSYDTPPPPLARSDPNHPRHSRRYAHLPREVLPDAESLQLTLQRVLPCWEDSIAPALQRGEKLLVAAHGNSIRALVKHLDGISDADITQLNIPTGMPLAYRLDFDLHCTVQAKGYLAGEEAAAAAAAAVAAQGKAGLDT